MYVHYKHVINNLFNGRKMNFPSIISWLKKPISYHEWNAKSHTQNRQRNVKLPNYLSERRKLGSKRKISSDESEPKIKGFLDVWKHQFRIWTRNLANNNDVGVLGSAILGKQRWNKHEGRENGNDDGDRDRDH